MEARRFPLVLEPVHLRLDLLAAGHVKDVQLVQGELVTRQGVGPGLQDGPTAAWRGRLDQIDLLAVAGFNPPGHQGPGIRGPLQTSIGITLLAVLASSVYSVPPSAAAIQTFRSLTNAVHFPSGDFRRRSGPSPRWGPGGSLGPGPDVPRLDPAWSRRWDPQSPGQPCTRRSSGRNARPCPRY